MLRYYLPFRKLLMTLSPPLRSTLSFSLILSLERHLHSCFHFYCPPPHLPLASMKLLSSSRGGWPPANFNPWTSCSTWPTLPAHFLMSNCFNYNFMLIDFQSLHLQTLISSRRLDNYTWNSTFNVSKNWIYLLYHQINPLIHIWWGTDEHIIYIVSKPVLWDFSKTPESLPATLFILTLLVCLILHHFIWIKTMDSYFVFLP